MNLRQFYTGRAIGFVILLAILGLAAMFYSLTDKSPVATLPVDEQPIVAENPEGEADPARMTLGMTTWKWISALYNDERTITPKTPGSFTLTFGDDGRFTATTDCNSMGGSYLAKDGIIAFSQIFSTRMFCEGSQETEFASLLETASGYHFTGRGELILDLKFDSGTATFR